MGNDGHDNDLPIPSYAEATSSRLTTTHAHLGAEETSDDAERQGLLPSTPTPTRRPRADGYRPPTVESVRGSTEGDPFARWSEDHSSRSSEDGLRREMDQMEVLDPPMDEPRSGRMRNNFSKQITYLTDTLSSLHLPFPVRLPSLASLLGRLPESTTPVLLIVGRLLALVLIFAVVYFFASEIKFAKGAFRQMYDEETIRSYVQHHIDGGRIREHLEHLTAFDHVAGTQGDFALAQHVHGLFSTAQLTQLEMNEYHVYLNYPRPSGRRVAIVDPPELKWEAHIEEDLGPGTSSVTQRQTLVFHGHSRAGNVSGPLIYANYGSRDDFASLKAQGIDVSGSVVLVRYYGTQTDRALKVKAAELAGAAGCIIYSDPDEDGFKKGPAWPQGRWMPADGVQRGAVSLMSWVVGDVLTPGWASTEDARRISKDDNAGLVNIPSLPLAWRDAQRLLQVLHGHGRKVSDDWVGGVPDVAEWWTGDATSPVVNLMNEQDEEDRQPIWNVLGRIGGMEQSEKTLIVGNHRDAWCLGAADPGSGTAILLEVVSVLGRLAELGWKPLRTIQFASWDGEEYNLIGSTEWVEENMEGLRRNGVGYLNLDTAISGTTFRAAASPLFERALLRVLDRTMDPGQNLTLREVWEASHSTLGGLGAGSDYVAFQDLAGTSSLDMSFGGDGFPYHSCYDNFEWMKTFGDPTFAYHKAMAEVLALLILEIADRPILPYDFQAYAFAVHGYVADLERSIGKVDEATSIHMQPLKDASDQFAMDAASFHLWEGEWENLVRENGGVESSVVAIHRMSHNSRMSNFETHLLDLEEGGGIPNRTQFKHIIFGPQAWSGYDEAYFPAIHDALEQGNMTLVQLQIDKAARILTQASRKLLN
ncbi:MAG: hypothetical protein M1838_002589 [Thelocarpon superellum]|nr:MAG: hypothetical protein M1838_002589 [Thelocarpon superellum]